MNPADLPRGVEQLKFRDPARAKELVTALERSVEAIGRKVNVMHVCGSHEQAMAKFGLRAVFPKNLNMIMGPGCPVCITDQPEVDEAVALALQGVVVATYGDMLRVPGTSKSLADAQAAGGRVEVVYSINQALDLARGTTDPVVFFATGFETTAVTTATVLCRSDLPANFTVLSAHKFVPPAMNVVAEMEESTVEGFLAAGHAATITGWGIFEEFVEKYHMPVVVAGFEPLDILAGMVALVDLVRDGTPRVVNAYPRCVTKEGNLRAQEQLWRVFKMQEGHWRGIADIPAGNLELREEYAHLDARRVFRVDPSIAAGDGPSELAKSCVCGTIMAGLATPHDCPLFGRECVPENPVGACMVSSEGTCKIWWQYGGRPDVAAMIGGGR
ncbi:MAG: hydrogenase formation protein HypD [Vicinamibacterales bacterium]